MSSDGDYFIKRGCHYEGIADGHAKCNEYKLALKMYKDAFNHFKKSGSKADAIRVKEKYESIMQTLKMQTH